MYWSFSLKWAFCYLAEPNTLAELSPERSKDHSCKRSEKSLLHDILVSKKQTGAQESDKMIDSDGMRPEPVTEEDITRLIKEEPLTEELDAGLDKMIDSDCLSPDPDIKEDISRLIKEEPLSEEICTNGDADNIKIEQDITAMIVPKAERRVSCSEPYEDFGRDTNIRATDESDDDHITGSLKNDARDATTEGPALYSQKTEEGRLHSPSIRNVPHKNQESSSCSREVVNAESLLPSSIKNSGKTFISPKILKSRDRFHCGDSSNDRKPRLTSTRRYIQQKCKDIFECNSCDRSFTSYRGFQIHKAFCNNGPKPCCCDELGIPCSFKSSDSNCQQSSLNGTLPFCCCVCGKYFRLKKRLKVHMVVHSDERAYHCDKCNLGFRSRKNLLSHMVIHNDVKSHTCSVCWKVFRRKNSLRQHMQTHSRERPFTCDQCGLTFKSHAGVAEHCKTHSIVGVFTCSSCPKTFKSRNSLYVHNCIAHLGTLRYTCNQCSQIIIGRKALIRHVAKCG